LKYDNKNIRNYAKKRSSLVKEMVEGTFEKRG